MGVKYRSKRVSVDSTFSTWEEVIPGVPEHTSLGHLLFNEWYLFFRQKIF